MIFGTLLEISFSKAMNIKNKIASGSQSIIRNTELFGKIKALAHLRTSNQNSIFSSLRAKNGKLE